MNEQALGIAAGALPLHRLPAPFVLMTGGKGGVGKTTLAVNLAVELASTHRRALLVDLDFGLANVGVMLRLNPEHTLEDFFAGRRSLADCVVRGPGGLDVLPASSGSADLGRPDQARRAKLVSALAELAESYELVVGDSAAGIGPDVLAFAGLADLVLVTTTPDPAALTDAFGLVKAIDSWAAENGREVPTPELILNLVQGADQADEVARKLRAVCERFLARSPRLAGWMPHSSEVRSSGLRQEPFAIASPNSLVTKCLRRLSARLQRLASGSARPFAA